MLKAKTTFYPLIIATAFSGISLGIYLSHGASIRAWVTVTNNVNESEISLGSSWLFLFLIGSLIAWINFVTIYLKHRKD
ncbi:hypothetical protein [Lactiplantibacillus plantarum]|uniref:hypothetical protein n=1 Tax=Lactiplantibacillus plantarum TaxID=1590 RepID=UPI001C200D8D|nr:hypothetical protein [Lactiplantibacillus plantarum]MBU7472272.1 hypothetical protein [Lactiplantibacillus plantarum]